MTHIEMTPRRTKLVLAAMLSGLLLAMLDQTIVGTALPEVIGSLGGGELYAWAVIAYVLPATVSLPIYARLSDRHGRRALLLVGMGLFLAGSALSGLAGSMGQLIAFRVVQGLGAGALEGLSFILVADLFRGRRSAAWQGAMAGLMGFSFLVGPLVGGLMSDHLGWRSVFLVNLPIGLAAMAVVAVALPRDLGRSESRATRPDLAGMVLLSGAIGLVLLGLIRGGMPVGDELRGWTEATTGGAIAAGLVLLAAFVAVERRAAAPLLPLRLLRDRRVAIINVCAAVAGFGMFGAVLLLPRYFQGVEHVSATHSGLLIYPLLLGVLVSVNVGAMILAATLRLRAVLVVSMLLVGLGAAGFATFDAHTPDWQSLLFMALIGLGVGPTFSGLQIAMQRALSPEDTAAGMGTLILLRQVGATVALALAETVYVSRADSGAAEATGAGVAVVAMTGAVVALAALASLRRREARIPPLEAVTASRSAPVLSSAG